MNKLKNILLYLTTFTIIFFIFKYNFILKYSVIDSVNIWLTKVFPSLFIMFILNDFIINNNILGFLNKLINPIFNKVFNTSGNSSNAFLLSLISGTPSSAYIIKEMLDNKQITINDANKLIAFTYFSNPLFLYNILSLTFNKFITIKIIIIHYLSNIIIGLIERNKYSVSDTQFQLTSKPTFRIDIIPKAITKSFNTMLMILGTITFFMIITNLIIHIFNLNTISTIIVKGIFEITQSLNILNNLKNISIIKEIIALAIISFGGLSIHTQIYSIINKTPIKYKYFLRGRINHVLISTCTYILCYMIISIIN